MISDDATKYRPDLFNTIHWRSWRKKFAFIPCKIHNQFQWFSTYYIQDGFDSEGRKYKRKGTLLDVIVSFQSCEGVDGKY